MKLKNIDVLLNVVGKSPIFSNEKNDVIRYHGFLDKSNNSDLELLHSLYECSDIFLMPSVAEGFGIVYMEAAAYGISLFRVQNNWSYGFRQKIIILVNYYQLARAHLILLKKF